MIQYQKITDTACRRAEQVVGDKLSPWKRGAVADALFQQLIQIERGLLDQSVLVV